MVSCKKKGIRVIGVLKNLKGDEIQFESNPREVGPKSKLVGSTSYPSLSYWDFTTVPCSL